MVNVESQVLYVWSRAVNERQELHSSIWSVRMCFKEFMSGASRHFYAHFTYSQLMVVLFDLY